MKNQRSEHDKAVQNIMGMLERLSVRSLWRIEGMVAAAVCDEASEDAAAFASAAGRGKVVLFPAAGRAAL